MACNTPAPAGRDSIVLRDILLRCIIGIHPEERERKQDLLINLTLYTDLRAAGKSDDILDTVDYQILEAELVTLVESSSFLLIERLAEAVGEVCLSRPGVEAVLVRIEKPEALRYAKSVGVEILRFRDQKTSRCT
jgi:D-erythro-7,8-dihydroneopterin triphosphate epimerase